MRMCRSDRILGNASLDEAEVSVPFRGASAGEDRRDCRGDRNVGELDQHVIGQRSRPAQERAAGTTSHQGKVVRGKHFGHQGGIAC